MFLWTDLRALVRHPFGALVAIDARRHGSQGALALGVALGIPAILAELGGFAPYRPPANLGTLPSLTAQGADIYARWVYQHRFILPIGELLAAGLLWLVAGGVIHLGARALKGRGDLRGYLKLVGFVSLIGLLAVPVSALDTVARLSANVAAQRSIGSLNGLIGLATFLWQNGLLILAAQSHYGLSLQRAVTAVLGPVGCLVVLGILLLVLGAVAAIVLRPTGSM